MSQESTQLRLAGDAMDGGPGKKAAHDEACASPCKVYEFADESSITSGGLGAGTSGMSELSAQLARASATYCSRVWQERGEWEESISFDKTVFMSMIHEHYQEQTKPKAGGQLGAGGSGTDKAPDPLVSLVVSAFAEVCRKIDQVHQKLEDPSAREASGGLDTVLVEDQPRAQSSEPQTWLSKVRRALSFAGNSKVPASDDELVDKLEGLSISGSAESGPLRCDVGKLSQIVAEVKEILRGIGREFERIQGYTASYKARMALYRSRLRRKISDANAYRSKLRARKKELLEARESLRNSPREKALGRVAEALALHLGRLAALAEVPLNIPEMRDEVSRGDVKKMVDAFAQVEEAAQRYAKIEASASAKDLLARELERQINELGAKKKEEQGAQDMKHGLGENALLRAENASLRKEAHVLRRESDSKDATINKQRLIIKLLQSKLSASRLKSEGVPQPRGDDLGARVPIVNELRSRISLLQSRMKHVGLEGPQRRRYARELEDCERRLRDFLDVESAQFK